MPRLPCRELGIDTEIRIGKPMEYAFYDARESAVYSLHGQLFENGRYVRMPQRNAAAVSPQVAKLNMNCGGGRVRFRNRQREDRDPSAVREILPQPAFSRNGQVRLRPIRP